ncbi:MAG: hypothetical protein V1752_02765 [Candidatus Firestonebacteria bacterium]
MGRNSRAAGAVFLLGNALILLILLPGFVFCSEKAPEEELLYGFENSSECDSLICDPLFFSGELVELHAAQGKKSCRMEVKGNMFFPTCIEGKKYDSLPVPDWSGFSEFRFDIYSEFELPVETQVKFVSYDGADTSYEGEKNDEAGDEYSVYASQTIPSKKQYTVRIPLSKITESKTSPDLSKMRKFRVNFISKTDGIVYIDNIRLARDKTKK